MHRTRPCHGMYIPYAICYILYTTHYIRYTIYCFGCNCLLPVVGRQQLHPNLAGLPFCLAKYIIKVETSIHYILYTIYYILCTRLILYTIHYMIYDIVHDDGTMLILCATCHMKPRLPASERYCGAPRRVCYWHKLLFIGKDRDPHLETLWNLALIRLNKLV